MHKTKFVFTDFLYLGLRPLTPIHMVTAERLLVALFVTYDIIPMDMVDWIRSEHLAKAGVIILI